MAHHVTKKDREPGARKPAPEVRSKDRRVRLSRVKVKG